MTPVVLAAVQLGSGGSKAGPPPPPRGMGSRARDPGVGFGAKVPYFLVIFFQTVATPARWVTGTPLQSYKEACAGVANRSRSVASCIFFICRSACGTPPIFTSHGPFGGLKPKCLSIPIKHYNNVNININININIIRGNPLAFASLFLFPRLLPPSLSVQRTDISKFIPSRLFCLQSFSCGVERKHSPVIPTLQSPVMVLLLEKTSADLCNISQAGCILCKNKVRLVTPN